MLNAGLTIGNCKHVIPKIRESHLLIYVAEIIESSIYAGRQAGSKWYDHNMCIDFCVRIHVLSLSGLQKSSQTSVVYIGIVGFVMLFQGYIVYLILNWLQCRSVWGTRLPRSFYMLLVLWNVKCMGNNHNYESTVSSKNQNVTKNH